MDRREKVLVLLVDAYPLEAGEFFLDDEMDLIAGLFSTVYIINYGINSQSPRRHPDNLKIVLPDKITKTAYGLSLLRPEFYGMAWKELRNVQKYFSIKPTTTIFKIIFNELVKGLWVAHFLKAWLKSEDLNPRDVVLYSYWHDYKALGIALLNKDNLCKTVSRGHGWDVDYKRHQPPYLPYKNFIVRHLTHTISISEFGKQQLRQMVSPGLWNKLAVNRLGKSNSRRPLFEKREGEFLVVSCSSLIPLKRVGLIVETLVNVNRSELSHRWVHFGDGPQREDIERFARESGLNFEIMGSVANDVILDFYAQNYVDLFINLSETEGIPVSVMEAQSAAIPVLATAVGGTPEIVNDDNGFLVPVNASAEQIGSIISGFLLEDASNQYRRRESAYKNWQEQYCAEKNYKEFYNKYLS